MAAVRQAPALATGERRCGGPLRFVVRSTRRHMGPRQKPLLRGWSHAAAAVAAVLFTGALCWQSWGDGPRLVSLLIFGLSVVNLYSVSALYHIGSWRPSVHRRLRALDHGNIYVA